MFKHIPLFLMLSSTIINAVPNKIIYMISPPRSLSTAFARMMKARGDCEVFNEPSIYAWMRADYPELIPCFNDKSCPTFDAVKKEIFNCARSQHVFLKEMSVSVKDFLMNDQELVKNPNVHFVFLMRNPHDSLISLYKKQPPVLSIDDCEECYELGTKGYLTSYALFEYLKKEAVNEPVVVLAEDVYTSPSQTIKQFCERVGISFKPEALEWENLSGKFSPDVWRENKSEELAFYWHGNVINSTQFVRPSSYHVDSEGKPTFSEIEKPEDKERYKRIYERSLVCYNKMIADPRFIIGNH